MTLETYYPDSKVTIAMWTKSGGGQADSAWEGLQEQVITLAFEGAQ